MTRTGKHLRPRLEGRKKEGGTVAVEFALVFVMFFSVMYAIVSYGIVFAVRHSLTQAANEGARAAVSDAGDMASRIALATTTAANAIAWLGSLAPTPEVTSPPCPNATRFTCVKVALKFDYAKNPILPSLPGLGIVLPDTIAAQATVQLDAVSATSGP